MPSAAEGVVEFAQFAPFDFTGRATAGPCRVATPVDVPMRAVGSGGMLGAWPLIRVART